MSLVPWDNFFVAQLGASAALTGLLFVGISINMSRILSVPVLPDRALEALALLTTILVVSSLMLVPGQSDLVLGVELTAVGLVSWAFITRLSRRVVRLSESAYRTSRRVEAALIQIATLSWVAAGVGLVLVGDVGVDFTVLAIVLSFLEVVQISWILLVEINR
jgi:modulator of FtsH protease